MCLTAFKPAILSLVSILIFITIQYRQESNKTTPPPQTMLLSFLTTAYNDEYQQYKTTEE